MGVRSSAVGFALVAAAAGTAFARAEEEVVYNAERADVRAAAEGVLSRPEFRSLPRLGDGGEASANDVKPKTAEPEEASVPRPGPSLPGLEWLAALFGGAAQVVAAAVIGAVLFAIGYLVVRGLLGIRPEPSDKAKPTAAVGDDDPESFVTPGETPADVYLTRARAAAAAGRFDEATSLLLLGSLGHAERAGLIRPRRGLTHRDYLRAVPRSSPWHPALSLLIRLYAPVGFGRRPATAETFASAVGPYESALSAEPAAAGSGR